jgi:hypothetical protein
MSTDPIQALIDAGVIPSAPFAPNSRYSGGRIGLYSPAGSEQPHPYVLRRFIPQRAAIAVVAEHVVHGGERPDTLAAAQLGDPELYWLLADANAVIDPFELTDAPGARVLVPVAKEG